MRRQRWARDWWLTVLGGATALLTGETARRDGPYALMVENLGGQVERRLETTQTCPPSIVGDAADL